MNILDVMTKEDLKKRPEIRDGRNYGGYNLRAGFIKVHGRAMGGFAKPMIFDRKRVEAYLDEFFGQAERERAEKAEKAAQIKNAVDAAISNVRFMKAINSGPGKMMGKGGRVRKDEGRGTPDNNLRGRA